MAYRIITYNIGVILTLFPFNSAPPLVFFKGYELQIEIVDAEVVQQHQLYDAGEGHMFLSPNYFSLGLVRVIVDDWLLTFHHNHYSALRENMSCVGDN